MRRPDQDRFDAFARHFESSDVQLATFCAGHNFRLERNSLRQPNRVLRREGNPQFIIDISLSEHWLKMDFSEDMPHTISVIAYYVSNGDSYVWRLAQEVACQERYSVLREKLSSHLEAAIQLINEWTPEVIMQKGQRSENLSQKYGVA